jgi:hypothetical protein
MTISVANIATSDTFGTWLSRTNDLATIASQNAVTVDSTVGGSISTGNGFVNGYFGANTLIARDGIAGGNLSSFGALNLIANIAFTYSSSNLVSVTANSLFSDLTITTNAIYLTPTGGNTIIGSNNLNITAIATNANTIATITGNTTLKANSTFNIFAVTGNNFATRIVANTSNTTITGNVFLSNTISVSGNATFSSGLTVLGLANLQSSANITGNLYVSGNSNIGGDVIVGGNLSITGTIISSGTGGGNLIPASTGTYYIGNSSIAWLHGYFDFISSSNTTTTKNLVSTGTATLNTVSIANSITVTGNATFSNTISVTGNATFSNTIAITGNVTFANTITVTGNATFSNTIAVTSVTSNVTFSNTITVTGNATFSNTISVAGVTTLTSNVAINSGIILNSIGHQFANSYTFTNSSVAANIDLVSASTYRSFEYLVQLSDSTVTPNPYYHSTKIAIIHDGTNPYVTEYGTLFNSVSLGSFNVIINGGNIALQLTPTTANVVAKFIRTSIV